MVNNKEENVEVEEVNSAETETVDTDQVEVLEPEIEVLEPQVETEDEDEEVELDETEQLKAQLKEEENKYMRLLADYDNFKRRASLDQEALKKYSAQSVITNLIPVLDNFSRALVVDVKSDEARSMLEGMEMIYRNLVTALESEGLKEIEAMDQPFDPNFHQAIMTEKDADKPSGVVLEDLQKGYILKDRVIRPSMVKVNE